MAKMQLRLDPEQVQVIIESVGAHSNYISDPVGKRAALHMVSWLRARAIRLWGVGWNDLDNGAHHDALGHIKG